MGGMGWKKFISLVPNWEKICEIRNDGYGKTMFRVDFSYAGLSDVFSSESALYVCRAAVNIMAVQTVFSSWYLREEMCGTKTTPQKEKWATLWRRIAGNAQLIA